MLDKTKLSKLKELSANKAEIQRELTSAEVKQEALTKEIEELSPSIKKRFGTVDPEELSEIGEKLLEEAEEMFDKLGL